MGIKMTDLAAFQKAVPIWLQGRAQEMNVQAVFISRISYGREAGRVTARLTASTLYRMWINGAFASYGPARAAHGYARVDEVDITSFLQEGDNEIRIEVAGYVCYSFYTINQPSFLQAEIAAGDRILAATGDNFTGYEDLRRERRAMRYSFQRPFSEIWNMGAERKEHPLEELQTGLGLLGRGVPMPDFGIIAPKAMGEKGSFTLAEEVQLRRDRYIVNISPAFTAYPEEEIENRPYYQWQKLQYAKERVAVALEGCTLHSGEYLLMDMGCNRTGFIQSTIHAREDSHYMISFDEKLIEGMVDYKHIDMINMVDYEIPQGKWENESFEAYGFRYACIMVTKGSLVLEHFGVRDYGYPLKPQELSTGDAKLDEIYHAALETYHQNVVDIYMDCPTRERAGWLCDSYYTAKAEYAFTGDNRVEQCFMENYRLYTTRQGIPKGMLPMCYPGDHADGVFIPQWAMWFVLELEEFFMVRSPQVSKEDFRQLCYELLEFFADYENEDGLLERLPSWNFVEWSKANDWVQDVNYPTNMLYSRICEIIGGLYGDSALIAKAASLRARVVEKSFNGTYFVDHALRDEQGELVNASDISEACQYYAIMFMKLDMEEPRYAALKQAVLEYFLPEEEARAAVAEIEPANALMGIYMRMELLYAWGRYDQLKAEMKAFFGRMAEQTGTLWENKISSASLNHGFASFAGALILQMQK